MPLTPEDLQRIAARTLAHYDQSAQTFWEGTRDHDVSQNIAALLQYIEVPAPFVLLDFGCGPGRDLKTFKALGHDATGLEGSPQLAAMARVNSGCEVLEQSFLALDLPGSHFDGVFGQRGAIPCSQSGTAARAQGVARDAEAGRRAVQFESPR